MKGHARLRRTVGLGVALLVLLTTGAACSRTPLGDAPGRTPDGSRSLKTDGKLQPVAFASVSAGDYFACGLKTDGSIACWGENASGQATPPTGTFMYLSVGAASACGVRTDGTLACWGDNSLGKATPPAP